MSKKQEHHTGTTLQIAAALKDIRAIQLKHDGQIMAMLFLDRAAVFFGHLKKLGKENDASLDKIFTEALARAKQGTVEPKVVDPLTDKKPAGKKPS